MSIDNSGCGATRVTRHPGVAITELEWALVDRILRAHLHDNERVWVFGARANSDTSTGLKAYADLDLLIEGATPLGLSRLAALREALSDSDLPYRVDLAEWVTLLEPFRSVVGQTRLPWPEDFVALS